jgi:hypothetical protein
MKKESAYRSSDESRITPRGDDFWDARATIPSHTSSAPEKAAATLAKPNIPKATATPATTEKNKPVQESALGEIPFLANQKPGVPRVQRMPSKSHSDALERRKPQRIPKRANEIKKVPNNTPEAIESPAIKESIISGYNNYVRGSNFQNG